MHLLRSLSFFVAHFDIYLTASHILGVINITADHFSRSNLNQAFRVNPGLSPKPTSIPPSIFHLTDWIGLLLISPNYFRKSYQLSTTRPVLCICNNMSMHVIPILCTK